MAVDRGLGPSGEQDDNPDGSDPPRGRATTRRSGPWALVALGAVAGGLSVVAVRVALPSPELFAGLVVGIGFGLVSRGPVLRIPGPIQSASQGVVGVVSGAYVTVPAIRATGTHLVVIVLTCALTLLVTVLAGKGLQLLSGLDAPTAAFGMIAGGAQGIVAMSEQLGADSRLVAVMQYLRLLLIVVGTPIVAVAAFGAHRSGALLAAAPVPLLRGVAFTAVALASGLLLARLVRLPAPAILGPMITGAVMVVTGLTFGGGQVPVAVQEPAYVAIGLGVGVQFNRSTLRAVRRVLLPALACTVALLAACALLGLGLAWACHATALDGYLATTPGGLYSVLLLAGTTGSDTTFVLSVQVLRLFMMLLVAPPLARRLARMAAGPP